MNMYNNEKKQGLDKYKSKNGDKSIKYIFFSFYCLSFFSPKRVKQLDKFW